MTLNELKTLLRVATAYWGIPLGKNSSLAYGADSTLWNYGDVDSEEPLFRTNYGNISKNSPGLGDSTNHFKRVGAMIQYIEAFPEGKVKQKLVWQAREGYDFCIISAESGMHLFPDNKKGFVWVNDPSSLYYVNNHARPPKKIKLEMIENKKLEELQTALFGEGKLAEKQNLGKGKLWHLSVRQLSIMQQYVNFEPLKTSENNDQFFLADSRESYSLSLYQICQGAQDRLRGFIGKKNLVFKPNESTGIIAPTVVGGGVIGGVFGPLFPVVAPPAAAITFGVFAADAVKNGVITSQTHRHLRNLHEKSNELHDLNAAEKNDDTTALLTNHVNGNGDIENGDMANDPSQLSLHQRWMFEPRHDFGRDLTRLMYAIYNNSDISELLRTVCSKITNFSKKEIESLLTLPVSAEHDFGYYSVRADMLIDVIIREKFQIFANANGEGGTLSSSQTTPTMQCIYLIAKLYTKLGHEYQDESDKLDTIITEHPDLDLADIYFTLLFQSNTHTPSMLEMETWMKKLSPQFQKAFFLKLLTNPSQSVIDGLQKTSWAKTYLKENYEKYKQELTFPLDFNIQKMMNASLFSFRNSSAVGTALSSNKKIPEITDLQPGMDENGAELATISRAKKN